MVSVKPGTKTLCLLSLLCIFFSSIFFASVLLGQEQEITDPKQREVSVTLKLIQVYVSAKDGNPVFDLTKDDFRLYDNGRLMTLTEFEIHRTTPFGKSEEKKQTPPRISRKFFLILDAYRNDGMGLKKARTTALHFIDTQVHSEDELGLLTYSLDRGLVFHKPLTTEHDKIREALNTVKLFPSITALERGATAMEEALDFIEYLNDFAVSLRYIPGYKHILLFSAGLPRSLLTSGDPRLRFEHELLAKELASSSSPIYTVDTQGTRDLLGGREQKGDDSLRRLSDLTGGQHFPNVDYREAISQDIQNATGNYYVLGYYVGETWDGKYHEIKVKVERKGVKVQAQKGYFNPKAFSKLSKLEKRHHLLDLARNSSPYSGFPQAMPSFSCTWWDTASPVVIHLAEILVSDLKEILADKIEYFTLVYNEEGVLIAEGKKDLDYTKAPPHQSSIYTSFVQPPGKYTCISVLRNKKTGAAAKAESTVSLPKTEDPQAPLSGPILYIPGRSSPSLPMEINSIAEETNLNNLSLTAITPQIKGPASPLVFMLNKDISRLYAVFSLKNNADKTNSLQFNSQLFSKTLNKTFPLTVRRRNDIRTDVNNTLILELELLPVPSGEYVLEISATGEALLKNLTFSQEVFIQ